MPAQPVHGAVMACDVGGTDIKAALVLPSDEILGFRRVATPHSPDNPGQAIVDRLARLADDYRHLHPEYPLTAIGLVVPGLVDEAAGIGIHSPNLGWTMFPFAASAESSLGFPVAFGHDVGAAGEAEFRLGAAASSQNAAVIVIGTGVAVSLFCDGRRIIGDGYAGELGHVPIPDPDTPGSWTILEKVGSAAAVASRYSRATGCRVEGARDVLAKAECGDEAAQRVWAEAVDALSSGIAHLVSLLGRKPYSLEEVSQRPVTRF